MRTTFEVSKFPLCLMRKKLVALKVLLSSFWISRKRKNRKQNMPYLMSDCEGQCIADSSLTRHDEHPVCFVLISLAHKNAESQFSLLCEYGR